MWDAWCGNTHMPYFVLRAKQRTNRHPATNKRATTYIAPILFAKLTVSNLANFLPHCGCNAQVDAGFRQLVAVR